MVWNNLVLAYEWLKEKDKAEAARRRMRSLLEEAVKVSPNDATAQATLAAVYAHYGWTLKPNREFRQHWHSPRMTPASCQMWPRPMN